MAMDNLPFDPKREEDRLNSIFNQIDSEFEGSRNNAASALRNWMEKYRTANHGLQLRLTLYGTSAERNLRLINEFETRITSLKNENRMLRQYASEPGLRVVDRHKENPVEDCHAEFVDGVTNHLYGGRAKEPPRGSAKVIAGLLGCSEKAVRAMLSGHQPVPSKYVVAIRASKPMPPPRVKNAVPRKPVSKKPKQLNVRPIGETLAQAVDKGNGVTR